MKCPHCKGNFYQKLEKIDVKQFINLVNMGLLPKEVAYKMGINQSTVYKYLDELKARKGYRITIQEETK